MKEIFCDKAVLVDFDEQNHTALLKESATRQKVIISGIPSDSVLLKLDVDKRGYKLKSNYFKSGTPFIHKGCDYCLIMPSAGVVVLFELKSDKPKGYIDQFIASEIFMEYSFRLNQYINCCEYRFRYIYVLLSTKDKILLTEISKVFEKKCSDKCGREVVIKRPGFPKGININKLL
jgi:hypothetical protein